MQMPDSFTTSIQIHIRKVGIIINEQSEAAKKYADNLSSWLTQKNIEFIFNQVEQDLDIIITLGGDGTLLRIAEQAARYAIPVIGVNLGNLGFLTELAEGETASTLTEIIEQGTIKVENRLMLKTRLSCQNRKSDDFRYALNDVVINKDALDRLLSMTTKANDDLITTYKADGLIFSSATGSTAYSLSAGGPLIHPGIPSILVTPICPFMLSSRPILLPGNKIVTTTFADNCSSKQARIIIDGQEAWKMEAGDLLTVEKAEHPLQLIVSSNRDYFQVLRNKLHWGGQQQ